MQMYNSIHSRRKLHTTLHVIVHHYTADAASLPKICKQCRDTYRQRFINISADPLVVFLRPDILLVSVAGTHRLDDLLALGLGDASLLRNDLTKDGVDLTSHVRCVTADVKVRLLQQQVVDLGCTLPETVLYVDLVWTLS